jgi:hypothetical protein
MSELLPGSAEVAFADLPATAEAAIATVVVVAAGDRIREAADALEDAVEHHGLRVIFIVADAAPPRVRLAASGIVLEGLKASYFDNALAALRLSSLPTLVW